MSGCENKNKKGQNIIQSEELRKLTNGKAINRADIEQVLIFSEIRRDKSMGSLSDSDVSLITYYANSLFAKYQKDRMRHQTEYQKEVLEKEIGKINQDESLSKLQRIRQTNALRRSAFIGFKISDASEARDAFRTIKKDLVEILNKTTDKDSEMYIALENAIEEDVFGDPEKILEYAKDLKETKKPQNIIQFLLKNHSFFTESLNTDSLNTERTNELDDIDNNTPVDNSKEETTPFGGSDKQKSLFDEAGKNILRICKMLPKYKKEGDSFVAVENQNEDQLFVFNTLVRILTGFPSDALLMYDELLKKQDNIPFIKDLLDILGQPSSDQLSQQLIWSEFCQTFCKTYVPLLSWNIVGNNSFIIISNTDLKKVQYRWRDNFKTVNDIPTIKKSSIRENYLDVKEFKKRHTEDDILFLTKFRKEFSKADPNKKIEIASNIAKEVISIFEDLGMPFRTEDTTNQLFESMTETIIDNDNPTFFLDPAGVNNLLRDENTTKIDTVDKIIASLRKSKEDPTTNFKKEFIKFSNIINPFSVRNANGDLQYEFLKNNIYTTIKKEINKAESITDPNLHFLNPLEHEEMHSSIFLNSVFDLEAKDGQLKEDEEYSYTGKRIAEISVVNISGVEYSTKQSKTGQSFQELDRPTKLLMHYELGRNGIFENPRAADKKTSFSLSTTGKGKWTAHYRFGNQTVAFGGANREYFSQEDISKNKPDLSLPQEANDYLLHELTLTIITAKKLGIEDIFLQFDDLIDSKTQNEIKEKLKDISPENANEIWHVVSYYDRVLPFQFFKFFNALASGVGGFEGTADLLGIAKKYKVGKVQEVNTIDAALFFELNQWVHNNEVNKIVFGGIEAYQKEEYLKRTAGANSTGDNFRIDNAIDQFFNNEEDFSKTYSYHLQLEDKDIFGSGLNDFKLKSQRVIRTGIIEDVNKSLDEEELSFIYTSYKSRVKSDLIKNGVSENEAEERAEKVAIKIKDKYLNFTEADGQGYIAFDTYRQLCIKENQWSDEQERVYQAECRGEIVEDALKFFPIKKFQNFGPLIKKDKAGRSIRAFHKFSLLPLIPSMVVDSQLEVLHKRMCKEGIGYVTFTSGSKTGNSGVIKMFKTRTEDINGRTVELTEEELDDNFSNLKKNVFAGKENDFDLIFLKDQLKMHDEYEGQVTSPTQLRGVIENVCLDGGVPTDVRMSSGQWEKLSEEEKENISSLYAKLRRFEKNCINLTSILFDEFLTECGISKTKDGYIIDNKRFRKAIKGRLYSKEFSPNILSVLGNNLDQTLITSVGGIEFQKALFSLWNKKVIHQKVHGEALVQVASTGFRKFVKGSEGKVLLDDRLKFYRKDENGKILPAQIKIALQGNFKKLLELTAPDGKKVETLERLNKFLREDESFQKQTQNIRQIVSARIPISSCNYIESYEIVEFLPENNGNMIVVPSALVVKSGGDFDIDKLYTLFKSFDVEDGKILKPKNKKNQIENNIVEGLQEILLSEEALLFLLTPDSTDEFDSKEFLESNNIEKRFDQFSRINTKQGEKPSVSRSMMLSGSYNFIKGCVNSEGFNGLSICAKMGKQYSVLQRCNVHLNKSVPIFKGTGKNQRKIGEYKTVIAFPCNRDSNGDITLGKLLNRDGQYIVNLATQFLSGSVDIAKGNDWIVHMTGSQSELGSLVFMTRIGMSRDIIASFTASPLIKKYIEFKRNRSTFLNQNQGTVGSKTKEFQYFLEENGYSSDYRSVSDAVAEVSSALKTEGFNPFSLEHLREGRNDHELQYTYLMQYLIIEQISNDITTASLQIDTDTRPDDSIVSIQERLQFFKDTLENKTIFSADSMKRLMKESSLASFFKQKELEEIYKLTINLPQPIIEVLAESFKDEKLTIKQKHITDSQEGLFNLLYQLGSKPNIKEKIETAKRGEVSLYQGYVIKYDSSRSNTEAYVENNILTLGVNDNTTDYDAQYAILSSLAEKEKSNVLAIADTSKIEESLKPFEDAILNKEKVSVNEIIPRATEFDFNTEDGKIVHCVFGTLDLSKFDSEDQVALYKQLLSQNPAIKERLSRDVIYVNEETNEVDIALNSIAREVSTQEKNLPLIALSKIASRDINAMFGKTSISYSDMMMVIFTAYPEILQQYPQLSILSSDYSQDSKLIAINNTKLTGLENLELFHIMDRLASPNILNKTISKLSAIDAFYIANFFSMFHTFASYQSGMNTKGTFGIMSFADPIEYNEVVAKTYHSLSDERLGELMEVVVSNVRSNNVNVGFNFVELSERNGFDLYSIEEVSSEEINAETEEEIKSGISNLNEEKPSDSSDICIF